MSRIDASAKQPTWQARESRRSPGRGACSSAPPRLRTPQTRRSSPTPSGCAQRVPAPLRRRRRLMSRERSTARTQRASARGRSLMRRSATVLRIPALATPIRADGTGSCIADDPNPHRIQGEDCMSGLPDRSIRDHLKVLWGVRFFVFWSSGWSRRGVGPDRLCERHGQAWMDGRWFPRWCRDCRRLADS